MVKLEKDKIIIEIPTSAPEETFSAIQESLLTLLESSSHLDMTAGQDKRVLNLLRHMVLDYKQIKS